MRGGSVIVIVGWAIMPVIAIEEGLIEIMCEDVGQLLHVPSMF